MKLPGYCKPLLFLLIIFIVSTQLLLAQSEVKELKTGITVEGELANGDSHSYKVHLEKDRFFFAILIQRGIDIIIEVTGPDGNSAGTFDSPNGTNGPEPIVFNTDQEGEYLFEIRPLAETEEFEPGTYTLHIEKNEETGKTPEAKIDQLMVYWDRPGSPGAAIAVAKKGEIIYSKGFGFAQLEYDIPIKPNTIFHIASISKQFTAYAMATLADQGLISLDEDIRVYLPYVPDFGKKITVRHLVHHTSGLRDQWNLLAMAGWRLDDVITKEHVIKLVKKQKELNFDPGAEHVYCNTGYTLMADIVDKVTGQSFPEWTNDHIFEPLGMTNTLFYDDHEKIVKNRAYSYNPEDSGFKKSVLSYANAGATSLFTTVEDISKWAWNFEKIKVGSDKIMEQVHQRGVLNSGDTIAYAFGQVIGDYEGLKTVSHGGADAGYRTFLTRFPDQDFSVVVFSNLGSFNPGQIAYSVTDIFLEDVITNEEDEEGQESGHEEPSEEQSEESTLHVSNDILDTYTGRYELNVGFILTITREENQLMGQATGQPVVNLIPLGQDSFIVMDVMATVTFQKDEQDHISQLTLNQGGGTFVAPRLEEFDPSSVNLEKYAGEFYSEELGATYTFVPDEDKLKVIHQRHDDFELSPFKENFFSGNRWFFGQVEFVSNDEGHVTGCKVSSGRVRNLVFTRVK